MHSKETTALKTLLRVSAIMSVTPTFPVLMEHPKIDKKSKYYSALVVVLSVIVSLACITSNFQMTPYTSFFAVDVMTDFMASVFSILLIITVVLTPLLHYQELREFLFILGEVSTILRVSEYCSSVTNKRIKMELWASFAGYLWKFLWDAGFWGYIYREENVLYYLFREFAEVLTIVVVLVILNLNLLIRHRYKFINEDLLPSLCRKNCMFDKDQSNMEIQWKAPLFTETQIRNVQKAYRKLGKLTKILSSVFGRAILLAIAYFVLVTFESLAMSLLYDHYLVPLWSVIMTLTTLVSNCSGFA